MAEQPTAETTVDFLTLAVDAAEDLRQAGAVLRDWHEGTRDKAQAKAAALALLRSAREGIAELIAEVERA